MKTDIVNFMAHRLISSYTCMDNPLLWRIEKLRINRFEYLSEPMILKYRFFLHYSHFLSWIFFQNIRRQLLIQYSCWVMNADHNILMAHCSLTGYTSTKNPFKTKSKKSRMDRSLYLLNAKLTKRILHQRYVLSWIFFRRHLNQF